MVIEIVSFLWFPVLIILMLTTVGIERLADIVLFLLIVIFALITLFMTSLIGYGMFNYIFKGFW